MRKKSRVEDKRTTRADKRAKQRARERKQKRGRSCWANCLITIVVLFVVFVGLLYGGGTLAWNKYLRPEVGISFNDALGLIGGIYSTKEKNVITNAYAQEDIQGFYTELSDALFLDEEMDLKESLSSVVDSYIANMVNGDSSDNSEEESTAEEKKSGITGNEDLDNFLKSLKFDFSKLKDYEDEYTTPHVLEITDKQTAAFLDDAIKSALKNESIKQKLPEMAQGITLENVVDIPQVIVKKEEQTNGLIQTSLTLTVRLNLRQAAKEVASGINSALGFATFLLPKKFLATITIYPSDYLMPAQIRVNSFNDKKMANTYALANYFLKDSEYGSIDGILQMINQKAVESIEKVQNIVPVNFVETGSVELHPIKAMMNALGATEVTETQFFCMVRDLCLPTFDDVKINLGFDSSVTYEQLAQAMTNGKNALVTELTTKYALEEGYLTADNMLDKIQGVGGETSELIEKVSLSNLDFSDATYNADHAKANASYIGLAGLLGNYLNKSSEEESSGIEYEIINTLYDSSSETLYLVLKIDVAELLGEKLGIDSPYKSLIDQILPDALYIKAGVCIKDGDASDAIIMINSRDALGTQELLDTISALTGAMGASGLDFSSIKNTVSTSVRDGLSDLTTKLGVELVFESNQVKLPSIYEIMANKILYSEEVSAENLTPAEVYLVFKGICQKSVAIDGVNKVDNLSDFTTRVNNRYAIKDENKIVVPTSDEDLTIVTQMQNLGSSYDTAIQGNVLAASWAAATLSKTTAQKQIVMHDEFNPYATEAEAATIFDGAFNITASGVKNIALNKVIVEDSNKLRLIYSCQYETSESTKYATVIPDFVINVLLDSTRIESDVEPCVTITINDMEDDELSDFALMCSRLGISGINIETMRTDTDTSVKDGLKNLFKKVEMSFDAESEQKKVYFGSLYELAYKNVQDKLTNGETAIDIADTISALHTELTKLGQDEIDAVSDAFDSSSGVSTSGTYADAEITARNLGASILTTDMTSLKANIGITTDLNLFQVLMVDLSSADSSIEPKNDELVENISSIFNGLTGQYLVVSFDVLTSGFSYESTLLPEKLYLTAAASISSGTVTVAYNNLSDTHLGVLKALAGSAGDKAFDKSNVETRMSNYIKDVELFKVGVVPVTVGMVLSQSGAGTITETLRAEGTENYINGQYIIHYNIASL